MRFNFQAVVVRPSKAGICPGCGARASRSTKFLQTLSPFNTNQDGSVKTRDQILDELNLKVAAWKLEPTYHARCE